MYKYIDIHTTGSSTQIDILNHIIKHNQVIILFHAEWCGHCINLMPIWEKTVRKPLSLDDLNKSHLNTNFIIKIENSYINILQNIEIANGFPSIFLYKKGIKVQEFNKERTPRNLKQFFKLLTIKKKRPSKSHYTRKTKPRKSRKIKHRKSRKIKHRKSRKI